MSIYTFLEAKRNKAEGPTREVSEEKVGENHERESRKSRKRQLQCY